MLQDFILLELIHIILPIDVILIIILEQIMLQMETLMVLGHMELELNLQNVEPGITQMIIMIVLKVMEKIFLIIVGLLNKISRILKFKMEMDLRQGDGEKIQKPKINMKNIVGKILLFILLRIVFPQIIKQMDFMLIISQDKQLFGSIMELIIIKLILI